MAVRLFVVFAIAAVVAHPRGLVERSGNFRVRSSRHSLAVEVTAEVLHSHRATASTGKPVRSASARVDSRDRSRSRCS